MYALVTKPRDENGDSVIPASQRPDGTWRKARRVKEGYVPQEEVPLYESKAKQLQNKQLTIVNQVPLGQVAHKTIPGLFIQESINKAATATKNKNKKRTSKEGVTIITEQVREMKIATSAKLAEATPKPEKTFVSEQIVTDPTKKLKNLKKRLREVEALEKKFKSGKTKPDADQSTKLKRKPGLLREIYILEKSV